MRRRRVDWILAFALVGAAASCVAFASLRAQPPAEPSDSSEFVSVPLNVPCVSVLTSNLPERREGWFFAPSRPSFFGGITPRRVLSSASNSKLDVDDEIPLVAPQNETRDAEAKLLPSYSLWAKFPVGSWARLRSTCVAQEKDRAVQSVTETRILLKSVDLDAKRYELTFERAVKLGGFDYSRSSETISYNFLDAPCDESTVVEPLESTNLVIAGKAIPCRTLRVSRKNAQRREETKIWYSPVVAPFVLQKETTRELTNDESSVSISELFVVQKTSARALFGLAPASYSVRSSSTSERRKSSASSLYSPNLPGGLIRETSVEFSTDGEGDALQTTTVLLDYYVAQ